MRKFVLPGLLVCISLGAVACGNSRYARMESRVIEPFSVNQYQITVDRDFDALELHPDYFTGDRMRPAIDDITKFW